MIVFCSSGYREQFDLFDIKSFIITFPVVILRVYVCYSMDASDTVVTIDAGAQGDTAEVDGVEVIDPLAEKATSKL